MFEDSRRITPNGKTSEVFERAGKTKAGMSEALGYARTGPIEPQFYCIYTLWLERLDVTLTEGKMPARRHIKAAINFLETNPNLGCGNNALDFASEHLALLAHALEILKEQHNVCVEPENTLIAQARTVLDKRRVVYIEPEKLMLEDVLANLNVNKQIFVKWLKDAFSYLKIQ
jgi:hypothetical protein